MTTTTSTDNQSLIERANAIKLQGNEFLGKQQLDQALSKYSEAISLLEPIQDVAFEVCALLWCNMATVYFAKQEYDEVLVAAEKGLEIDPSCAPCVLRKFNALWKKGCCVLAIMTVHEFLNEHPGCQRSLEKLAPAIQFLSQSKQWFLHPDLRIIQLSEDNFCVMALEDIPEKTVLVKDSIIFPHSISSNDQIPIVLKELMEHFDLYQNRFKGLHPRRISDLETEYFEMWYEVVENMVPDNVRQQREIIEEFTRLLLVVKLNGFAGVYGLACLFNHACAENAEKIDNEIVSTRGIKKGQYVNLDYIGYDEGVLNRQNILSSQFAFTCACDRCKSELLPGSLADSFKCQSSTVSDCKGLIYCPLLTEEEMQVKEDDVVRCSNFDECKCEVYVDSLLAQYKRYRQRIERASTLNKSDLGSIIESLGEILSSESILVPQHHLFLSALPLIYQSTKVVYDQEIGSGNVEKLKQIVQQFSIIEHLSHLHTLQIDRYGEEHEDTMKTIELIHNLHQL